MIECCSANRLRKFLLWPRRSPRRTAGAQLWVATDGSFPHGDPTPATIERADHGLLHSDHVPGHRSFTLKALVNA
jgi:hypothetical protein